MSTNKEHTKAKKRPWAMTVALNQAILQCQGAWIVALKMSCI